MIELEIGSVLKNNDLTEIFGCSPQGGMRRSHATNTLVIISNHVDSIYDDRWIDGVLHYTGMGQEGDQSIEATQNRTLAESDENDVSVHLFEVFTDKQYTYTGEVALAGAPYFEHQADKNGLDRRVVVFPLRVKDGHTPLVPLQDLQALSEVKAKQARKLPNPEVEKRAKAASKGKVGSRQVTSIQYSRDPWVAEFAKRRANGICQLCDAAAPFKNKKGEPYLETHHIVWLAKGGEDTVENTVALCPNCHRKLHVAPAASDVEKLKSIVGRVP